MRVVSTQRELRPLIDPGGCVLVPTMGALHRGHAELITRACDIRTERGLSLPIVVTVFVNPTQFNDPGDLARYPRTLDADVAISRAAGADCVFAPAGAEVYPTGKDVPVPRLPAVATEPGLEDAFRPGHFAGVCQVVSRLFELTRPALALFGEKDWQQLKVIQAMTRALTNQPRPEILGVPTVREPDGLALSSRNIFLSPAERSAAGVISAALRGACRLRTVREAEAWMAQELRAAGFLADYAVVRDAETLLPLAEGARRGRSLIAARIGSVRLIDNAEWTSGAG